jgi:hypothetical protein
MEIPDINDFYKRFTAVSKIKDALRDTFKNSYFIPLTETISRVIQKTGYSYEDVTVCMRLKHISERNIQ